MRPQIDVDFGKTDAAKPRAEPFSLFARIGGQPPRAAAVAECTA